MAIEISFGSPGVTLDLDWPYTCVTEVRGVCLNCGVPYVTRHLKLNKEVEEVHILGEIFILLLPNYTEKMFCVCPV